MACGLCMCVKNIFFYKALLLIYVMREQLRSTEFDFRWQSSARRRRPGQLKNLRSTAPSETNFHKSLTWFLSLVAASIQLQKWKWISGKVLRFSVPQHDNKSLSWVVALCRILSLVVGLISGVPTSAAPRLVLQISDLHLRRYPIQTRRQRCHWCCGELSRWVFR